MKPTLLLDMDGVLVDHNSTNMLLVNERFGTAYEIKDVVDFAYAFMPVEHADYARSLWQTPGMYDDDTLTIEQLDVIMGLREICRVVACTSPLLGHIKSKYKFLLQYFEPHNISLLRDKTLMAADILIDDAPHNIKGFPGHVIIYDQPWNQGIAGPRARTFDDLGPLVTDFILSQELRQNDPDF